MKSIPVSVSSARMLRPSRPMMRPFRSSDSSCDDRHGGLRRVAARDALHAGGEDAAGAAVGVAARLLLDLADEHGAVVAELVLELASAGSASPGSTLRPGDPLELADLLALARALSFSAWCVEVARAVLERALAPCRARRAARRAPAPCPGSRSSIRAISARRSRSSARCRSTASARRPAATGSAGSFGGASRPLTHAAAPRGPGAGTGYRRHAGCERGGGVRWTSSDDNAAGQRPPPTDCCKHDLHVRCLRFSGAPCAGSVVVSQAGVCGPARHQAALSG